VKPLPPLDAREFDRLADATRLGANAREMARQTLVEGQSMHAVAARFGTIPQRVRLAVGSIHRVQAALIWNAPGYIGTTVPSRLREPLSELIASFEGLSCGPLDDTLVADLQKLLTQARQRAARV
jgi:hypothetical protein